jgi:hypothetical protein
MRDRSLVTVARHALVVAGLTYIGLVWLRVVPYAPPVPDYGPAFDARGFWIAWDGGLYDIPWRTNEAYVYSPLFAQVLWPLTLLPWPIFVGAWSLAAIGCLFWMRVPWMIAFPGVIDDILRGNVHVFMAAAIVLALRASGSWAFPILTKVTPLIGLGWHAVRGEWRPLAVAIGTTAGLVAISFVFSASLWIEWIGLLVDNAGATARIQVIPLPLLIRLPIAFALVLLGARTNRAWLVPVGVMIGLPNVWTSSTALLAAAVALRPRRPENRPSAQSHDRPIASSS